MINKIVLRISLLILLFSVSEILHPLPAQAQNSESIAGHEIDIWELWRFFPEYTISPKFTYKPGVLTYYTETNYLDPGQKYQGPINSTNISEKINGTSIDYSSLTLTPEFWKAHWDRLEAEKKAAGDDLDDSVKDALSINWEPMDTSLRIYGQQTLSLSYGHSGYIPADKANPTPARSSAIKEDLDLDQRIDIHISGKIGRKVKVNVDNSGKSLNRIKVDYTATSKEAFVQNVSAGNISVSLPGTSLASGTAGGGSETLGVKLNAQKGMFDFQFIASMSRGIAGFKTFKGLTSQVNYNIKDMSYIKLKIFILPQDFQTGSLRLYMDDHRGQEYDRIIHQSSRSNRVIDLNIGEDYTIRDGRVIEFRISVASGNDIFMVYTPTSGSYTPSADPEYSQIITNLRPAGNEEMLYLLKEAVPSPYEFRGYYKLSQRDIIKNDPDFLIQLQDPQYNVLYGLHEDVANGPVLFNLGNTLETNYYLNEETGELYFRSREPFSALYTNTDHIYSYNQNPALFKSYIHLEYSYRIESYQLHWNVVEQSEIVKLDGRIQLRDTDYTIDYTTGTVKFKTLINPEAEITIAYQYTPFGFTSQQSLIGLKALFKPADWFNMTGVGYYSGKQRPLKVPTPLSASDERLIGAVSANINMSSPILTSIISNLGGTPKKPIPVDLTFNGEIAGSFYNPNNFGAAILEDFEGAQLSRSVWMDYKKFYPYAPLDTARYDPQFRGKIAYKDYYDYRQTKRYYQDFDYVFTAAEKIDPPSDRTNVPYAVKTGPYMVGQGHLEDVHYSLWQTRQSSMVIDYDFSSIPSTNKAWVSLIYGSSFDRSGADFSDFSELDLWVKFMGHTDAETNSKIKLRIGLGQFNEDFDGDKQFEEEGAAYDTGIIFNDASGAGDTVYGGGSQLIIDGQINTHDGYRQSEDLDNDGYHDVISQASELSNIYLPDAVYASSVIVDNQTQTGDLTLRSDGRWKKIRILIDKTRMTPEELDTLKNRIQHLVLFVERVSNSKGRLLIDDLEFTGVTYNDRRINGLINNTNLANHMEHKFVSTFDELGTNSYFSNSLWLYTDSDDFHNDPDLKREKSFDDLHGRMTTSEYNQTEEHALELSYFNLQNHDFSKKEEEQTNTMILMGRNLPSEYDLRFYRELKIWIRTLERAGNEWFFYRFGSSDLDYWEYRIRIDKLDDPWNLVTINREAFANITNSSYENINQEYRISGKPILRTIRYIGFGIYADGLSSPTNNYGRIWLNDNYVDKVQAQTGLAYQYGANLNLHKHLNIAYAFNERSAYFSSVGAAGTGISAQSRNITAKWTSIPMLPVTASWNYSISEADLDDVTVAWNEKGKTTTDTKGLSTSLNLGSSGLFGKAATYLPVLTATYRISSSSNLRPQNLGNDYSLYARSSSDSLGLGMTWIPPGLHKLKINTRTGANYSRTYSESETFTYIQTNSQTNFVIKPESTSEKWKLDMNMAIGKFNITPVYNFSKSETGKSQYYLLEFGRTKNFTNTSSVPVHLTSRSRSLNIPWSFGKIFGLIPRLNHTINYTESGFSIPDANGYYERNPTMSITFSESVGSLRFKKFFINTITPKFSRSVSLSDLQVGVTNAWFDNHFKEQDDYLGWKSIAPIPVLIWPQKNFGGISYFPMANFLRSMSSNQNSVLSIKESVNTSIGFNLFKAMRGTVAHSYSQTASRNRQAYTMSRSQSLSYGSSLDLMKHLNFFIWYTPDPAAENKKAEEPPKLTKRTNERREARKKERKSYKKSSTLGYSLRYNTSFNYSTAMREYSLVPNLTLNYKWSKESDMSLSGTYTYKKDNMHVTNSMYTRFTNYLKQDLQDFYSGIAHYDDPIYPRNSHILSVSLTYRFPSNLSETWSPFFARKKELKLDTRINHTATVTFSRTMTKHNILDKLDPPRTEKLAQILYQHQIRYDITQNIDGDIWGKIAIDSILERTLPPTENSKDKIETIFSWEIGMKVRIRF